MRNTDLEKEKKPKRSLYLESLNVGFYLATPLLVGVFVGIMLDKWLQTKPIFILVFIAFGTIASLYNLYKLTQETNATH